jgi:hypothetical protein
VKYILQHFITILLFSVVGNAQQYHNPYLPMEFGKTWVYSCDEFPDSLISGIVDTTTINNQFYYGFSPYRGDNNRHIYWLRPEPQKIFALNPDDSTEYLLFDFEALPHDSWEIPPALTPFTVPVNQCDWGSSINLYGYADTLIDSKRGFYGCYLFAHLKHPCFDAGISNTIFGQDYGIVAFSQVTEGGVLDWELVIDHPDTCELLGIYSIVGNPCLTSPCLPGVVSSVTSNDTNYILTMHDSFIWNGEFSWRGYFPEPGDSIMIEGIITARLDCFAQEYFTCEVINAIKYIPTEISDKTEHALITKDILHHNYPNPFNPDTNIKYFLANPCHVKLILYDIQGRKVKILVNEYQTTGKYNMLVDGKDLPSGMYYYQFVTNNHIQTKSMILIK